MEKQIVNIFLLLGFNYYMIKSWGTRKVTILTLIGNYFLISILIESYFGLPKFIEDFNALFMLGIGMVGTYILWRKNKAGTLTEYEKRGWILNCTPKIGHNFWRCSFLCRNTQKKLKKKSLAFLKKD